MLKKLKFLNDVIIAVIWCSISILGGILIYIPEVIENTVLSKLSDAFVFVSTGTFIDTLVFILLFSYSVVCLLLATTSFKLEQNKF
jgi:hypothetical protein